MKSKKTDRIQIPDNHCCGDCTIFRDCQQSIGVKFDSNFCEFSPLCFEYSNKTELEKYIRGYKFFKDLINKVSVNQLQILLEKCKNDSILGSYLNVYENYKGNIFSFLVEIIITHTDILEHNMQILKSIYNHRNEGNKF